jgi:ubiquinol-cytochrome c reductase cytochrome b subunit
MTVLAFSTVGLAALLIMTVRSTTVRAATAGVSLALVALMVVPGVNLDPKFWGVVLMGASVLIFLGLPWLDRSPVKSMRYRPGWHFTLLIVWVVAFIVLGYFGTQPPSTAGQWFSMVGTVIYFAFFVLMPWWSRMGTFKPVPERVTFKPH